MREAWDEGIVETAGERGGGCKKKQETLERLEGDEDEQRLVLPVGRNAFEATRQSRQVLGALIFAKMCMHSLNNEYKVAPSHTAFSIGTTFPLLLLFISFFSRKMSFSMSWHKPVHTEASPIDFPRCMM